MATNKRIYFIRFYKRNKRTDARNKIKKIQRTEKVFLLLYFRYS